MSLDHFASVAGRAVEFVGIAVLIAGAVLASIAFVVRLARGATMQAGYHELRADLGRAILLGLEFLVIADIIGTVAVEPTLQNLGVLAVIVAIRTLLSFALELEVSGRWPWQKGTPAG
ncbi:DUF1622 domain-containing protein [Reyranella sp.]|uniref:DUF1622 domain-containing protein n=1 Tax=Reyranella sp. TaxID=1929291 RepID=UPI003D10A866